MYSAFSSAYVSREVPKIFVYFQKFLIVIYNRPSARGVAICENRQFDDKLRYKNVILLKINECGKKQRKQLDVQ
jgi:hypothetical protein